jgi:hypothetical protein
MFCSLHPYRLDAHDPAVIAAVPLSPPLQAAENGPSAALRFALRHCGVLFVRLIPQDLRALHLDPFEHPARF